jgi:hypothetical protein
MKSLLAGLLLVAAFAASGCAPMGMTAQVQIRSAPPPPLLMVNSEPHFRYLSDLQVSVVSDESFGYDMFSVGGSYYLYSEGYWYRSQNPRGDFVAVDARRVPRRILDVDDQQYRWRRHPEGWRAGRQKVDHDDRHGRGDNNGQGNGGRDH